MLGFAVNEMTKEKKKTKICAGDNGNCECTTTSHTVFCYLRIPLPSSEEIAPREKPLNDELLYFGLNGEKIGNQT